MMDGSELFNRLQEENVLTFIKLSGLSHKQVVEAINLYKKSIAKPKTLDGWQIKETQYQLFGEDHLD